LEIIDERVGFFKRIIEGNIHMQLQKILFRADDKVNRKRGHLSCAYRLNRRAQLPASSMTK